MKISLITFTSILVVVLCFSGCMSYKTSQFINTPTSKTNQKKYIKPETTEVYLLGTTHKPTNKLNIDSLYNALEIIKPDIILYEYDATAFDSKMSLRKRFYSILPNLLSRFQENEGPASKKYISFNKNTIIRPYEWTLRNKWHKEKGILKMPEKVFAAINKLDNQNKLSNEHRNIVNEYYRLNNDLNKYADSTIFIINTKRQDSISKKRCDFQYHKVKEIIDKNPDLKQYKDFWSIYEQYWDLRNIAMSRNICDYIKLNPQKRIVVLNGYFHRYYLKQELERLQEKINFKMLEINDIK